MSSPREREKRHRRDRRRDETEGQGRKRNRKESKETEEIKIFPSTITCYKDSRPCPTVSLCQLDAPVSSCNNIYHIYLTLSIWSEGHDQTVYIKIRCRRTGLQFAAQPACLDTSTGSILSRDVRKSTFGHHYKNTPIQKY